MFRGNNNQQVQMNKENQKWPYWCHTCKCQFRSRVQPGQTDVKCPKCNNEFCQLINPHSALKYFEPFQKQPIKKQNKLLRLNTRASPVRLLELQQMLQEEQHQRQGIQLSHQQLQRYKQVLQRDSECSVCRQDLKVGTQQLIFRCRHAFHEQCLVEWLRIKNSCPTCRKKMISD